MNHSIKKSSKLLSQLFDIDPSPGPAVLHIPKPGREAEAAASWIHTGVCMSCKRRAISSGRCVHCGEVPKV
jgi:hypothetical protein